MSMQTATEKEGARLHASHAIPALLEKGGFLVAVKQHAEHASMQTEGAPMKPQAVAFPSRVFGKEAMAERQAERLAGRLNARRRRKKK